MPKPGGGSGGGGGGTAVRGTNGNDSWAITDLAKFARSSYDGRGGSDTLDFSGTSQGITLFLNGINGSHLSVDQGFIGVPMSLGGWSDLPGHVVGSIKNVENITGGSGNDHFESLENYSSNYLYGGGGNDYLSSYDYPVSGRGSDILIGGSGEDWISTDGIAVGGEWDRNLSNIPSGDGETDTFFGNSGTILDFVIGTDRLVLSCTSDAVPGIQFKHWSQETWIDGVTPVAVFYAFDQPIKLVGITALDAADIPLNFSVGRSPDEPNMGGLGDDYLGKTALPDVFILPVGGGMTRSRITLSIQTAFGISTSLRTSSRFPTARILIRSSIGARFM